MPRLLILPLIAALALSAVACGSGGGGEEDLGASPTPATSPTPDTFDPNVLTALVVQPSEVPEFNAAPPGPVWNPNTPGVQSFTYFYGTDNFGLQTTVGRYATPELFRDGVERIRVGYSAGTGGERNANLPEGDLSFIYQLTSLPATYVLETKDTFFVLTGFLAKNQSRAAEVLDVDALKRYHQLAFDRVLKYIADPSSVAPVASAAPYPYTTPSAAAASPTPAP